MKYFLRTVLFLTFVFLLHSCEKQTHCSVSSPDENICVTFLNENGVITYEVTYKGTPVIDQSKLGIKFKGLADLSKNFEILEVKQQTVNKDWNQIWGEFKTV